MNDPAPRRWYPNEWGLGALFLLAAIVMFLLLAFEAFHGKAVNRAEWCAFALFAAGVLL